MSENDRKLEEEVAPSNTINRITLIGALRTAFSFARNIETSRNFSVTPEQFANIREVFKTLSHLLGRAEPLQFYVGYFGEPVTTQIPERICIRVNPPNAAPKNLKDEVGENIRLLTIELEQYLDSPFDHSTLDSKRKALIEQTKLPHLNIGLHQKGLNIKNWDWGHVRAFVFQRPEGIEHLRKLVIREKPKAPEEVTEVGSGVFYFYIGDDENAETNLARFKRLQDDPVVAVREDKWDGKRRDPTLRPVHVPIVGDRRPIPWGSLGAAATALALTAALFAKWRSEQNPVVITPVMPGQSAPFAGTAPSTTAASPPPPVPPPVPTTDAGAPLPTVAHTTIPLPPELPSDSVTLDMDFKLSPKKGGDKNDRKVDFDGLRIPPTAKDKSFKALRVTLARQLGVDEGAIVAMSLIVDGTKTTALAVIDKTAPCTTKGTTTTCKNMPVTFSPKEELKPTTSHVQGIPTVVIEAD